MLLPSGFANTRCSACRFEPRSLHVPTPSRARNGFAEPRDREPKSTLSRPWPAAETARVVFEPRKCPQSPHDRRPIRAETRATLVASIARGRRWLRSEERRVGNGAEQITSHEQ